MSMLVGRTAPAFSAEAALGSDRKTLALSDYRDKNYVVLFFYPGNFTEVCHSELHAFQNRIADFTARGVQLIACSVDPILSHIAWLKRAKDEGGVAGITYPLIGDDQRKLARLYDVEAPDSTFLRALFIIDKSGIVRHQSVNELSVGRGIDEVLRTLDAIQHTDTQGRYCPANWKPGEESLAVKIRSILTRGNTAALGKSPGKP